MKEKLYKEFYKAANINQVIDKFHDSIIDTNRGYKFFVDWDKVRKNVERYKVELNILNTLIGSRDIENDLRTLLKKYPEILPVFPILIAVRDINLKVIRDFVSKDADIVEYNFKKRRLSESEIESFIEFFHKTGLNYFFNAISQKSIYDYASGIEVGMDTNARKNRSGTAMENLVEPILNEINEKIGKPYKILVQKNFKYAASKFNLKINKYLLPRKADFILVKEDNTVINIEANFFSGTGSKPQEIVDSYINRQEELKENGIKFIWVTDGYGWKGQKNQIEKGFNNIDYLLNLNFCKNGLLENILCKEI